MMTVQQVMRSAREQIITWYDQITGRAEARRKRQLQYVLIAVGVLLFGGALFGVHRWYVNNRERNAQKSLAFCMDEYFKAQRGAQASWAELAERIAHAANAQSSSYLYPHFKALQADALVHAGDLDGALKAMEVVHRTIRSADPLYWLCMLKYRLMQLDSVDEAVKSQGLSELVALAHNQTNICADAAQYYLGQYYLTHNEQGKAQEEWKLLATHRRPQPGMSSPWAELVTSQLTQ